MLALIILLLGWTHGKSSVWVRSLKALVGTKESLPRVQSDEGQDEKRPADVSLQKSTKSRHLGGQYPNFCERIWAAQPL